MIFLGVSRIFLSLFREFPGFFEAFLSLFLEFFWNF